MHAYRYLHFKVISIEFNANVSYCPLDKAGGSQDKHQLQVSWKCSLQKYRTIRRHNSALQEGQGNFQPSVS